MAEEATEVHPRKITRFPFYPNSKYTLNKDIVVCMIVDSVKTDTTFILKKGSRIVVHNPQTILENYGITCETLLLSQADGNAMQFAVAKEVLDEQKLIKKNEGGYTSQ